MSPKILLLDDKPIEEQNWIRWCRIIGWDVKIYYCQTIRESIDLITTLDPDIYLIDIFLQNELGFEFLQVISDRKGLKVVTTNSVNQEDYIRATKYSAFILNKEYEEEDNLEVVRLVKNLFEKEKSYSLNIKQELLNAEEVTREIENIRDQIKMISLKVGSLEEDYKVLIAKQDEQDDIVKELTVKQNNSAVNMIIDELIRINKNANPITKVALLLIIIISGITVSIYFVYMIIEKSTE